MQQMRYHDVRDKSTGGVSGKFIEMAAAVVARVWRCYGPSETTRSSTYARPMTSQKCQRTAIKLNDRQAAAAVRSTSHCIGGEHRSISCRLSQHSGQRAHPVVMTSTYFRSRAVDTARRPPQLAPIVTEHSVVGISRTSTPSDRRPSVLRSVCRPGQSQPGGNTTTWPKDGQLDSDADSVTKTRRRSLHCLLRCMPHHIASRRLLSRRGHKPNT